MSSSMVSGGGLPATVPASHTGLDSLPAQLIARLQKRGFVLNLLVAGRGGLGKSTLVNTLFAAPLSETGQGSAAPASLDSGAPRKTTEISVASHLLSENGVQVRLSIIDTPGFGDLINNENAWEPIVKYIKDQYSLYLRRELTPNRDRQIIDTRVHAVLYFLFPSGHGLAPLDLLAMKALSETCNVIPIIAKSDALTLDEREAFKARVREELRVHGIQVYPNIYGLDFETLDEDQRAANDVVSDLMPFAVVGSERNVVIDGKAVPGRRTKWGMINVQNPAHCEFPAFRQFLLQTHTQDLIETTALIHYESFRTKQLLALKESTGGSRSGMGGNAR